MKETYVEYRKRMEFDETCSETYAERKLGHRNEYDLVAVAIDQLPSGLSILDLPCGGGRFSLYLAERGFNVSSADRSPAMVDIATRTLAEAGYSPAVHALDVEDIDLDARSVDAVFCFRLFHHIPEKEVRTKVVAELCRVADRYVVMSYFNSRCLNMVRRRLRDRLKGKLYKKYGTPLSEVCGYFSANGFALISDTPERRWLRPLHLAVFKRR